MQEDRLMVLQMLADGRITVEEADVLLRSLEETAAHAGSADAGNARPAKAPADGPELGARLCALLQQVLDEADAALDRAVRTVEERLAELERREPYRQIRQLADSLDRAAAREAVRDARVAAKEAVREAREAAKEAVQEALEAAEEAVAEAVESAREAVAEAIDEAEEAVADALEAAEEAVQEALEAAEDAEEEDRDPAEEARRAARAIEKLNDLAQR